MVVLFWIAAFALLLCLARLNYLGKRVARLESRNVELNNDCTRRAQLASQVAHEIKNPLTAILCSAQALDLLVGPKLEPIHQRSLKYIKEYGEHLLHLVGDFIDLNRVAGGAMKVKPESIELFPLLESLTGLLSGAASTRKVTLCLDVDKAIVIRADSRHTKQVLFNLLHNAIKFSPYGGEVRVVAKSGKSIAEIEVIDCGIGIELQDLPRIFSPFYTGSHGRDGGLGLGLSVCRSLVELNQGNISAANCTEAGACFKVTLPLCQKSIEQTALLQLRNPLQGQRFLVVNHDQGVRDALTQLVTAWGGIAAAAENIEAAISELNHCYFDAVLIDEDDSQNLKSHCVDVNTPPLVSTDGEQEKLLRRLLESSSLHTQH